MTRSGRFRAAAVAFALTSLPPAGAIGLPRSIEFLGRSALPIGSQFDGERIGGLSGLTRDAATGRLLAVSDDPSRHGAARFYEIEVDLADGHLDDGDWRVVARHTLRRRDGEPFTPDSIDPEGIALSPSGALYLSTEGAAASGIAPFVARLDRSGRIVSEFRLPRRFRPNRGQTRGVRQNLGFESLTVSPSGRFLFAATENALVGDGPQSGPGVASPSRIAVWDLSGHGARREFVYRVGPVVAVPPTAAAFRLNGLVDLLALSDGSLLSLEREYVEGVGARVVLYAVELGGATDVAGRRSLLDGPAVVEAHKRPLLDFSDLGIPVANFEGMSFGPDLPDGRRSLLVVVDDNFDPSQSPTLLVAFAVDDREVGIGEIQGAAHRSPLEGRWVNGVEGIVTAIDTRARPPAFFLQALAADEDPATSEAVRVTVDGGGLPTVGERLRVGGRVEERSAAAKQLSVTTLAADSVERRGQAALPAPVRLFDERTPPRPVDDDALAEFDPGSDAIDFWESLEGMRVELPGGTVSGPTLRYGEFVLLAGEAPGVPRTTSGGELLAADGPSARRVMVSGRLAGGLPDAAVGDAVADPVVGVVDYSFSNYKVLATARIAAAGRGASCAASSSLSEEPGTIRVATSNVENLSATDPAARFELAGRVIAHDLGAPAIVSLEEIEDDSGTSKGDGVVGASRTLGLLVEAIAAAGGPRYDWVEVDPELDREGGIPGGNIRVVLLYDPARVSLPRRGEAGPLDATEPRLLGGVVALDPNPGRVEPASPAFTLLSGEGVRRSLAVEFEVEGRPFFVVANHWSSKYDDDRTFGSVQPPVRPTGAKRMAQSRVVRAWMERLLALDPGARAVVLGDLNDLPWSEAVEWISRAPLVDLTAGLPAGQRYSYNFEGASQLIDYLIVTPALGEGAEIEAVHRNSDCPDVVRASDHDPLVARLRVR